MLIYYQAYSCGHVYVCHGPEIHEFGRSCPRTPVGTYLMYSLKLHLYRRVVNSIKRRNRDKCNSNAVYINNVLMIQYTLYDVSQQTQNYGKFQHAAISGARIRKFTLLYNDVQSNAQSNVYATVLAVASSAEYVIQFETSIQSFWFFISGK